MACETCNKMTEWYLKENPEKRGYVLCELCFEKSKEYTVYLDMPYQPERSKREDILETTDKVVAMASMYRAMPNFNHVINSDKSVEEVMRCSELYGNIERDK